MVDSHVLVGSCAQIGSRVHLSAGVQIGGVLEPPGRRPSSSRTSPSSRRRQRCWNAFWCSRGAVIAAGVVLTGTSRLYDLARERVIVGTLDEPLVVPAGAVVAPGVRQVTGDFAAANGLALSAANSGQVPRRAHRGPRGPRGGAAVTGTSTAGSGTRAGGSVRRIDGILESGQLAGLSPATLAEAFGTPSSSTTWT